MNDGSLFALGAAGLLAIAGEVGRRRVGSLAKWSGPREEVKRAAVRLRDELRLSDVRVSAKGALYLLGPASALERLIEATDPLTGRTVRSSQMLHRRMLGAVGVSRDTARSYAENVTHWDGLYDVVELFMRQLGAGPSAKDQNATWFVRVIPAPGGPREATWSAKTGKVLPGQKVKPFRFCEAGPVVRVGAPADPVLLDLDASLPPVLVSHGVDFRSFDQVRKCGGFLWPSFAVSWRVPASYGDVVFLASANTVARAMETRKGNPFYLASTDIWSPTAKTLGKLQSEVTDQLAGRSQRGLQGDLLISSSSRPSWESLVGTMSYSGGDVSLTDRVRSRSQLVRALRGMMREHVVAGAGPYVYPQRPEWESGSTYRYPYAELKVVGVVPVSSAVACLYPKRRARRVETFLDSMGFTGARIWFDYRGPDAGAEASTTEERDAYRRRWARAATAALLAWSEGTPGSVVRWR